MTWHPIGLREGDAWLVDLETGCWLWQYALTRQGYGRVKRGDKQQGAHRAVYELFKEPISEGLTLDHLCRVRHCVNPEHLEPVTLQENLRRGRGRAAENARKTHCQYGHPLSGANLRIRPNGDRACRACSRRTSSEFYWAQRGAQV